MIGERATARAREMFLSSGQVPAGLAVRAEIVDSWRRSLLYGVSPAAAVPVVKWTGRAEGQLLRAARPVLDKRRDELAGLSGGLTLTDEEGVVLERWVEDGGFARRLDARNVLPGVSVSELAIGTNSGGTSVEIGRATMVVGHEHFAAGAVTMTTAGAPIRHPLNSRLIGSLNLNCPARDTHPLLMIWIRELVAGIEEQLLKIVSARQRNLLDAYLRSTPDARHPVVCLDSRTVINNAAAARLLGADDHARLWEVASRGIAGKAVSDVRIDLSTGLSADVEVTPVMIGGRAVGAVVRLVKVTRDGNPGPEGRTTAALPGLAGGGPSWRTFAHDLRSAVDTGAPVLLVGEAGTGKLAAARAACRPGGSPAELDAPCIVTGKPDAWIPTLRDALSTARGSLILRRIDVLDPAAVAATTRLLASAAPAELRVTATARSYDGAVPAAMLDWQWPVVWSPPLRDRLEDLPALLAALTREVTGAPDAPRWSAEVVQTLTRVAWPANLHSLAAVVGEVLRSRPGSLVRAGDLPPHVAARGARRSLARLEQAEAHTIMTAVRQADGNKRAAADALGIARSTLYRKVRALGLDLDSATF